LAESSVVLNISCGSRLRQAANDMYFKVLTLKHLGCQPEPVEGELILKIRIRRAHPDNLLKIEPLSFAKSLKRFL
jgi:hypothetical protein